MSTASADIVAEAERELRDEDHREQVDAEKARLRQRKNRTIWERVFPWKITVTRR